MRTKARARSRWTSKMAAHAVADDLREALPEMDVKAPRYNADRGQYNIAIVDRTNPESKAWGTVAGGAIVTIEKTMDVVLEDNWGGDALAARITRVIRRM